MSKENSGDGVDNDGCCRCCSDDGTSILDSADFVLSAFSMALIVSLGVVVVSVFSGVVVFSPSSLSFGNDDPPPTLLENAR